MSVSIIAKHQRHRLHFQYSIISLIEHHNVLTSGLTAHQKENHIVGIKCKPSPMLLSRFTFVHQGIIWFFRILSSNITCWIQNIWKWAAVTFEKTFCQLKATACRENWISEQSEAENTPKKEKSELCESAEEEAPKCLHLCYSFGESWIDVFHFCWDSRRRERERERGWRRGGGERRMKMRDEARLYWLFSRVLLPTC